MKNSTGISVIYFLLISACHSNQPPSTKRADSQQTQTEAGAGVEKQQTDTLAKSPEMVKAESPDALVKFEPGYALPRVNDGMAQSPINIISSRLQTHTARRTDLSFTGTIIEVENLGHTIQVDFAKGSVTLFNGVSYELIQLHFHTPSEHLIDGMTFPMEMHIVGKSGDSTKKGGSVYTVMGVLFKIGRENKFLKEFLGSIPMEEGENRLDPTKVRLKDLFVDISNRNPLTYYRYEGSLTTQPYTESVHWAISNKIFEASEEQIAAIEKLEGNNARHVRALNNRKIAIE